MSTQITTGKVRFSYCNLFTPRAVQEGATPKYSVTLLIPKSDKATMQKIKAAMDEAITTSVPPIFISSLMRQETSLSGTRLDLLSFKSV